MPKFIQLKDENTFIRKLAPVYPQGLGRQEV